VTAAGPARPGRGEGGGFAAAHYQCAARLWPGGAPREGYGAAPPASRVLRIALRATALRAALDPGDLCGPAGRKYGQAQPAPPAARRAPCPGDGHTPSAVDNRRKQMFDQP